MGLRGFTCLAQEDFLHGLHLTVLAVQMVQKKIKDELLLRPAGPEDWQVLLSLCRASFPYSVRWASRSGGGARWWCDALASPNCECWIARRRATDEGFTLLIDDEADWRRRSSKRSVSVWRRALGALMAPRMTASWLLRLDSAVRFLPAGDGVPLSPADRLFVELIAVVPKAQGSGLGRRLVEHAEQRARSLGRRGVYYRVARANEPMLSLMAAAGYRIVGEDRNGLILSRLVD